MIVTSQQDWAKEELYQFLRKQGVRLFRSEDFQAIGRLDSQGRLIGVVAFNGFVGKTAMMHCAGIGNWVSRDLIIQSFRYPFVQLGLSQLFAAVAADNPRALKFDKHIGFKEWETIEDGWDQGTDLHILRMKRAECKWIQPDLFRKAA